MVGQLMENLVRDCWMSLLNHVEAVCPTGPMGSS